jgi:hypothetical protein
MLTLFVADATRVKGDSISHTRNANLFVADANPHETRFNLSHSRC